MSTDDSTAPETGAESTETAEESAEETIDWQARAEKAEADAAKWKAQSRKNEQRAKNQASSATRNGQEETEPVRHGEPTETDKRLAEAEVELAATRIAAKLGADAVDLLDSLQFRKELDAIDTDDLDEFAEEAEKLFRSKLKGLKKTAPAKSTSGGEFTGGSGATQPITEEQLANMSPQQIEAAFSAGKLKHLM